MSSAIWRRFPVLLIFGIIACAPRVDRDPFLVLAGPKDVTRFEVTDEEGTTLWLLDARSPQSVDAIVYAAVPAGFIQLEPADRWPPRPLEPGELVITTTTTGRRLFTHFGVAKSATTMEILNYSMELVDSAR